jgi:hypothetical protein
LLSRFVTGLLATDGVIRSPATGTLSRPRMLVAAAPTTRKQVMAMMLIILVKQFPVCFPDPVTFPRTGR